MASVTLLLACLLGLGLVAAHLGRLARLPAVTGYIATGLVLGPTGFGLLDAEMVGQRLEHFVQIALMLIAFGIGEHLELRRIWPVRRQLLAICCGESVACFVAVAGGVLLLTRLWPVPAVDWRVACLLAAIAIATAPASVLLITRELRAAGPLTNFLLQGVASNNAMAIGFFGLFFAVARQTTGDSGPLPVVIVAGLGDIGLSLLLGLVTGIVLDFCAHRLTDRGEMLTCGLALLLFCGEAARLAGLSPLLAGMAAGFAVVNRDRRDVRLFRAINAFEPPITVLFFILAGAHLDRQMLGLAGWLGIGYFVLRGLGKVGGVWLGGWLGGAPPVVRRFLGLALLPQAGVAIGLVVLVQGEAEELAAILTPVVLAGVFLAELIGPVLTRQAIVWAGETADALAPQREGADTPVRIPPWRWQRLAEPARQRGVVVFGASLSETVTGLARIATLLAHYYGARPLAVRVVPPDCRDEACAHEPALFKREEAEVRSLGYNLSTAVIHAEAVADALVVTARQAEARAVVLGDTGEESAAAFDRVIGSVVRHAPCPVVVVRFCGELHTERLLVPVIRSADLELVADLLGALAGVGRHRITLLRLLPADVADEETAAAEQRLRDWAGQRGLGSFVYARAVATDARLETVIAEAQQHDCLVLAAPRTQGVQRLFFGSLALDVVRQCPRPAMLVYRSASDSRRAQQAPLVTSRAKCSNERS